MKFIAFLFGLVFGSFYNVVVYRLPRGKSLVTPGSSCPNCSHELTVLELVPVLSYVWQKGRCKNCSGAIHWRYPVVEFASGAGFLAMAWTSPSLFSFLVGTSFFSLLLVLALIDLEHKILPNKLTLPGTVLGLVFALIGWSIPFKLSILGGLVGFLIIFLIALLSRGGMGMGDAKLLAMIGTFLGWKAVFYVLFGASFLGSIGGITYLLLTKQDRKTPIPFGPSLALAAFVVYLWLN